MPKANYSDFDTVKVSKRLGDKSRALDIIWEAQNCWMGMYQFRQDRERNKKYTYGKQWDDYVCIDGKRMREEDYIVSRGNIPLKNNHIRRLVRNILGIYRNQNKEPTCIARDRDEQQFGETMSTLLQYNMQLNRMNEINTRCMEEFLISGLVVQRKWAGWKNDLYDCWTETIHPNNFFIDCNMKDFRGWDVGIIGEIHDISFDELCTRFAKTPEDKIKLDEIYKYAKDRTVLGTTYDQFGFPLQGNFDFLTTWDVTRCRVIEVWRKEMKPRYRCHDINNGEVFKVDIEDFEELVGSVNRKRLGMARELGMEESEVPLIRSEWFMDSYWYYYYLSPFGDILEEGETPYEHKSHPYVFKAYPFIDGEIHSFVSDVIDQQRYVNRLITMYDWIMRASAKGVLLFPEECLPNGYSMDDIADEWARFDGVIMIKDTNGKSSRLPQQVANNCTQIGISELLNLQLKFFEDISGVNGALQGKPGYSGMSAALYNQQTQNATTSLLDTLETYSSFIKEGAIKDMKNIQQFYDAKKVTDIAGKSTSIAKRVLNIEFDLSMEESTATPVFRAFANDILMKLFEMGAINVQQLLEQGSFPFADSLLQSIQSQQDQIVNGQAPEGVSPEIAAQVAAQANPQAVAQAQQILGS